MRDMTHATSIPHHQSLKGLKSVQEIILSSLKSGEEYRMYLSNDMELDSEFEKRREQNGIRLKILTQQDISSQRLTKIRKADRVFPNTMIIFGNHVVQILPGPVLFMTKSTQNYLTHKAFFDKAWRRAT